MPEEPTYLCPHCQGRHERSADQCPKTKLIVPETCRLEGEVVDGKYRVDEKIGIGGMGVVYKGEHLTVGRKLAIKFLHADMYMSETVAIRFQNEARAAATVGHNSIVDIIDLGKFRDKFHYIVMEFIEGEDLKRILKKRKKLPVHEAVEIMMQILGGLRAVHAKKILHRDLKPENIFVMKDMDGNYVVKIVDFGICRITEEARTTQKKLTQEGMVCGTPIYMSPEHARGRADMDHRADLYSAATILYEMITGAPPLDADNVGDLLIKIVTDMPVPPSEVEEAVPEELSQAVMKALSKNPDDRFADANEFMDAIGMFASRQLNELLRIRGKKPRTYSVPAQILLGRDVDSEFSVVVERDAPSITPISIPEIEEVSKASTVSVPATPTVKDGDLPAGAPAAAVPVQAPDVSKADTIPPVRQPPPAGRPPAAPPPFAAYAPPAAPLPAAADTPPAAPLPPRGDTLPVAAPSSTDDTLPPGPPPAVAFMPIERAATEEAVPRASMTENELSVVDTGRTRPPKRRRGVVLTLLVVTLAAVALVYFAYISKTPLTLDALEALFRRDEPPAVDAGLEVSAPADAVESEPADEFPSEMNKLTFTNLPADAMVFVNGVLHTEMPIVLERSTDRVKVTVESGGAVVYSAKLLVEKDRTIELDLVKPGETGPGGEGATLPPGTKTWNVTFTGLPKDSRIYVDGVLHPERPVVVARSIKPYRFRVESGSKALYDKQVRIKKNSTIPLKVKPKKKTKKPTSKKQPTTVKKKGKLEIL
jgi:serine/threonine protein kinase